MIYPKTFSFTFWSFLLHFVFVFSQVEASHIKYNFNSLPAASLKVKFLEVPHLDLRLSVSTGSNSDCLRRPGCWARNAVAHKSEQSGQSQSGGDEGGGASLLPGWPGHLAQGSDRLPQYAVKDYLFYTKVVQRCDVKKGHKIMIQHVPIVYFALFSFLPEMSGVKLKKCVRYAHSYLPQH